LLLRREARKLLRLISHTDDHQVRRNLARRAFELVRQAEKLRLLEEANQTSCDEPPIRTPSSPTNVVIDDPDIFHAAKLVIDQRGEEAANFAAGRADLLLEEGDLDGSAVWRRILAAIEELQRAPRPDEAVN
jgi:hypothetical protein